MRWNQVTPRGKMIGETPTPGRMKTKWDETPLRNNNNGNIQQTPNSVYGATPTPQGAFNLPTPSPGVIKFLFNFQIFNSGLTPLGTTVSGMNLLKLDKDIEERNRPLSEEELDQILPSEGYEVNIIIYFDKNL